ncbi:MAG: PEP/pyruvate-binding domain-containing protein [Sandaracinaceae bacterium]
MRSSSPDEDLGVASFAGGYETRLGVARDGLEEAVRACFASCLDARVLVYKREHGFDPFAPRIAVIVQQQVDSEVAGVAFSVNPLTNDYDEAVFDASWGLGESVVSGAVTPDHFVVDKVDGGVLSRELGAKQTSLHVAEDGPRRRRGHRSDELCLTDAQLAEATRTLTAIEAARSEPVDVELAWAGGRLHVLQARPITAWVPLHPSMQTRPGERRASTWTPRSASGLATNAPLSPFGGLLRALRRS